MLRCQPLILLQKHHKENKDHTRPDSRHPHTKTLLSMPGIGPKSAAQILMTVGDISDFPSAAHLASYAGLSPRTNQSNTPIMPNSVNRAIKKIKTLYNNRLLHRSDTTNLHNNPTNKSEKKTKDTTPPSSSYPADSSKTYTP
ncbi:IS110 family transposase [Corynebacterium rouxii]|uniref:IS110 family transposase n=1 Tax=Corynebacterium rouxii TaxID=2719119 RepID=UPI003CC800B2